MPKLYDYFGLTIIFYANEHEPVHVHAKCQGREARAELILVDGKVVDVQYSATQGRPPLNAVEMRYFKELVSAKAQDILAKWIDFFVLNTSISAERITRRLK